MISVALLIWLAFPLLYAYCGMVAKWDSSIVAARVYHTHLWRSVYTIVVYLLYAVL